MSSQQKQIRDAAVVLLSTISGVTVFRAPRREIGESELPALAVYSVGDRPESESAGGIDPHRRVYTLRVEIRVKARVEDDATDDLAMAVRRVLLPSDLGDPANRCIDWTEQVWDGDEGEWPISGTCLDFAVSYLWRPE